MPLKIIFKHLDWRQALRAELEAWVGFLARPWPGFLGAALRYLCYLPFLGRVEGMPFIRGNVRLVHMGGIRLGRDVFINSNTYIYGRGGVVIGDRVLIAPQCVIVSGEHVHDARLRTLEQPTQLKPVVIGDDVWMGAGAIILGGVTVGAGCIIGAGAVVTRDTEANGIYAGIPARKLRQRPAGP